jgi:pilus assembly protein CpaB
MVTALLLAAAGSTLVFLYVQGADRRAVAGKQAVQVLVAARTIPAGTPVSSLADGWVRSVRMPAESLPDDVVTTIDGDLSGLVVGAGLRAGELVRRPLLVAKGGSQGFSVPDGALAVTIALTDPQRVAGYVKAGAKVAVFASYKLMDAAGKVKNDATGARLLMSGVDVLSTGPSGGAAKDAASGADTKTLVTLAVTQQQAEKLIWAANGTSGGSQQSALYLGLQSDSSVLDPAGPGVTSFTFLK